MKFPTARLRAAALALLAPTLVPAPAQAQDLTQLQRDMKQMQQQYETAIAKLRGDYDARMKDMETRLKSAEDKATSATSTAADAQKTAEATQLQVASAPAPAPEAAASPPASAPASASGFNPAIGAVLNGTFTGYTRDPKSYRIPGFALGDEARLLPRGFSIGESEINLQANADPYLFANLTLSFPGDKTVGVEEGFVQSTSLPFGLTAKAGRFFSGIGYLNEQHSHTWDFVDQPLPYRAFLNNQYGDDGVQVRWLAPTDRFLEFGAEAARGDAFPAGGTADHNAGVGAWSLFAHTGDDIGDSANYRIGLSQLWTKAKDRTTDGLSGTDTYSGTDHTYIADAVLKWAPNGNFVDRYVKLQGEYFLRQENGNFNGSRVGNRIQTGWYLQGVYQFLPRWRVGLRYDQVHAASLGSGFAGTTLDNLASTSRRYTSMVDYSTSEFGRFRLQYSYDRSRPAPDNQFVLQYVISIGAHGAHIY